MRPGEKLYEELLATTENTLPTHHKKFMIGRVRYYDFEEMLVARMKDIVPEFTSMNSRFEVLDHQLPEA